MNLSYKFDRTRIEVEATKYVDDNEIILINQSDLEFEVLHVPGHTTDSVAYYHKASGSLFVGDIIFAGSVGRSDFPLGNGLQLIEGIKTKIFTLPDEVIIYPGHGPVTSVGFEKATNPRVR